MRMCTSDLYSTGTSSIPDRPIEVSVRWLLCSGTGYSSNELGGQVPAISGRPSTQKINALLTGFAVHPSSVCGCRFKADLIAIVDPSGSDNHYQAFDSPRHRLLVERGRSQVSTPEKPSLQDFRLLTSLEKPPAAAHRPTPSEGWSLPFRPSRDGSRKWQSRHGAVA